MFPKDVVCLRNIYVDTLHKGDTDDEDDDDDDDDDNNNNNNNNNNNETERKINYLLYMDDLKLLGRNENDLKNEIKIVQTISKDINMNLV